MVMLIKLLITNYHSKCEHIELYTYIRPAERGDRGGKFPRAPRLWGPLVIFCGAPVIFSGEIFLWKKLGGKIFSGKIVNRGQRKKFAPGPRKALCGPGCSIKISS
jgi:hypothetical protein